MTTDPQTIATDLDLRVKYRPRQFRHLVQGLGNPVVRSITRLLVAGMAIPALLVRGGFGVGKTTIIRLIGQRLCCLRKGLHTFEPCGQCESCKTIIKCAHHADVVGYSEYDVQARTVLELIHSIEYYITFSGMGRTSVPRRIIALDEFHRLGMKEQERFVKIIEDWSRYYNALFLFCATPNAELCPALVSRCTSRLIRTPEPELITRYVQKVARCETYHLPRDIAELLVAEAAYVPRDCLGLLQDVLLLTPPDHVVTRQVALDALELWRLGRGQDNENGTR